MGGGRHQIPGEQLLATLVAGRMVAFAIQDVVRVLPLLPLWRPPTAPTPLRGFLAMGGGVLPVLSARALLGLGEETEPDLYAHVIWIRRVGGQRAGLLVDRAYGFVTPAKVKPVAVTDTLNGCATATFDHEGGRGWLLDPERLLGAAEDEVLAALVTEAARRRSEWTTAA